MFDVKMSPYADNQSPIYRYVARFERTFDWNDIFKLHRQDGAFLVGGIQNGSRFKK